MGCRHVRCVVATLGGNQGVGAQFGNWKSLHAGFTVWLSQTEAAGTPLTAYLHDKRIICAELGVHHDILAL